MVFILLVWIIFTFLSNSITFHSFQIFQISQRKICYLHTVHLTIWYQLFLQLWLVHTLFLPFHVINQASWSTKLDINLLNRRLPSDSYESLLPQSTLSLVGSRKIMKILGLKLSQTVILAIINFSSIYRDTQICEGVLPWEY